MILSAMETYQGADNAYGHYTHEQMATRIIIPLNVS